MDDEPITPLPGPTVHQHVCLGTEQFNKLVTSPYPPMESRWTTPRHPRAPTMVKAGENLYLHLPTLGFPCITTIRYGRSLAL